MANPESIINTLDYFGFAHIEQIGKEIRCGHDATRNKTSIRIKLKDNDNLYVNDFSGSASGDFFSFIIKEKGTDFRSVIQFVKSELRLDDDYTFGQRTGVFDNAFKSIKRHRNEIIQQPVLDGATLNKYQPIFAKRFLDDNIPVTAQQEFDIRYDAESQRIVIPIYDNVGNLIGIKGRANWDIEDDEPKYLYLNPCKCSETLYGYAHNYQFITDNDIYVCESEKSVMQAWGYDYKKFVGLGGSKVSNQQCKLLMELRPKRIILLHDVGLDIDIIMANVQRLKSYTRLLDTQIGYWNWAKHNYPDKASPTDLGCEVLTEIMQNQIIWGD